MQKEVPRNFTKFTRKHLCQSLFFIKVTGLRSVTLLKKRNWHRYIPVKFVKFLRTPFYRTLLDDCFYIKLSSLLLLVPIKTTQWLFLRKQNSKIKEPVKVSLKLFTDPHMIKTIPGSWKPLKNHEKCFLFHVRSSFLS